MYLKCNQRKKDGKIHRYWSVMESYRLNNGCSAKRQVLYLGELNGSQLEAWKKSIEVFDVDTDEQTELSLYLLRTELISKRITKFMS